MDLRISECARYWTNAFPNARSYECRAGHLRPWLEACTALTRERFGGRVEVQHVQRMENSLADAQANMALSGAAAAAAAAAAARSMLPVLVAGGGV